MTPKRPRGRVSHSTHQSPSIALFESLSESRISVLYLARRAKETKDMALAKELTKKGQSLKNRPIRTGQTGGKHGKKRQENKGPRPGPRHRINPPHVSEKGHLMESA